MLINQQKTLIVMVGLPARGKTYTSKRLARYLNWIGINTKAFNASDYRRHATNEVMHDFFDPHNVRAAKIRYEAVIKALADARIWLYNNDGKVAIFDAPNTTLDRRKWIINYGIENHINVIFIESICNDIKKIEENIMEVKLNSPDYQNMDKDAALEDFKKRIEHYAADYRSIDDELEKNSQYIKIINFGERFIINKINGSLANRIVFFIMNIRSGKRTIYITRHGESEFNLIGRIGGDANLSEQGQAYSRKLAKYFEQQNLSDFKVWTSNFKRTKQTAQHIDCDSFEHLMALNEIDAGVCEGFTYEEIAEKFPEDFAKRDQDKYFFRYHQGESYHDVVLRLEPVIMQLETEKCVLVICHQAVARCLVAYFQELKTDELPYIKVPLHSLIKITPSAYRSIVEEIGLSVSGIDTHRIKPNNIELSRTDFDALSTVPPHL